jgi:protein involved in polysaccharide export with SLBB domain
MRTIIPLIVVLSAFTVAAQDSPHEPSTSTVTVEGSVRNPGVYPIFSHGEQITVMTVIEQAGGLFENAADAASILRFFRSEKTQQTGRSRISVSLSDIRNGKTKDVLLQAGDVLTIPEFVSRRRSILP